MQPVSRYTNFLSARIVWVVRHWITRLEGKDMFCNHLSWLAEGGDDYKGDVVTKPITNCWGTCMLCFCSGSRRNFATRTIVDRDLQVLKAFLAVGLRSPILVGRGTVSPHSRRTSRYIPEEFVTTLQKNALIHPRRIRHNSPEELVDTSQKNLSPHSRRTRWYIPEEFVTTAQKNASIHLRRICRHITEGRADTPQKNLSPHSRRTRRYIPEEFVTAAQKNASIHPRIIRHHSPEGRVDTSQKNLSPHSRRTRRHILGERVAAYQKSAPTSPRRTPRHIPEEWKHQSELYWTYFNRSRLKSRTVLKRSLGKMIYVIW